MRKLYFFPEKHFDSTFNLYMSEPQPPRLLDRLRSTLRLKHMSLKTEKSYINDVRTTMVYTHVLNRGGRGVRSPLNS